MKITLLPRIQLILAVLFGLLALFGPLFFRATQALVLLIVALGAAFGLVTFWIGWLAAVKKREVEYPFRIWSILLLRPFLKPGQVRALQKKKRPADGRAAAGLGFASMLLGAALLIALAAVVFSLNR
jgi:hypothetical protein